MKRRVANNETVL